MLRLRQGEVIVEHAAVAGDSSPEIPVDGGLINHWRGTMFIPAVTLDRVLAVLQDPNLDHRQEDVLAARIVPRDANRQKLHLRIRRTRYITAVYDADYDVEYRRLAADRALSNSVSTRIVDGKSGFDKWSQTFDRKASDSFAVQSDIAAFVTDALLADLDKAKRPSERIGGTKKGEAFDAFLRGMAAYRLTSGKESDLQALDNFERAVAIDPNYAAAFAALSRTLTVFANNYATKAEIPDYYRRAIAAARSAVRLAPNMAEGHSALGFVLFNGQLDAREAAAPYQRSYELGFGNAEILSAYANFAGRIGRFDDGREAIARAQQLDPLNPLVFRNAGFLEYAARDFAAAENQFRTALSINPNARNVRATLGDIALVRGDLNAARSHFSQEGDLASRFRGLAIVEMKLGRAAEAEAAYAELLREGGDTVHYQQAQVLAQWGRKDDALKELEQALALRDAGLVRLRNDPLLDPVREDARFAKIEQTIGFT